MSPDVAVAAPPPAEHEPTVGLLLLTAGGATLALHARLVHSVQAMAEPTALPGAPAHLLGLVRAGEHALPLLDLAAFLELDREEPVTPFEARGHIVVVEAAGMRVGLCCRRVTAVRRVDRCLLRTPETVRGAKLSGLLEAELEQPEGAVGLIDCAALLQAARLGTD